MLKLFIYKLIVIVIGSLLLFRLININEGISVSATNRPTSDIEILKKAINGNPFHAYAHEQIALIEMQHDRFDTSKQHAIKALKNNLSSGMATAILMNIYDHNNDLEKAHQAAQLSAHLWPSHDVSMQLIANHWLQVGRIDKALSAWNVSLNQTPLTEDFSKYYTVRTIYPILNEIAQHENSTELFQLYHAEPPIWWNHFFHYMVKQPNNLQAVDRFYQQTLLNGKTSPINRKLYLSNLIQEKKWSKAYDVWKQGLPQKSATFMGLIYDGGFESGHSNDPKTGNKFGWIIGYKPNTQAYLDKFSRAGGSYSLRIAFNSWINDYWGYISQILVLKPGNYDLNFKTRANLNSTTGIQWIVQCANTDEYLKLGSSAALSGSFDWKNSHINFTVPDNVSCEAQKLTVVLASNTTSTEPPRVRGDIWFDDFIIKPID